MDELTKSIPLRIVYGILGIAIVAGPIYLTLHHRSLVTSTVDTRYFNTAIRPQDDLYRYVNGKWLDAAEIPADKAMHGAFTILADEAEAHTRTIIEGLEKNPDLKSDAEAQKMRDLYFSFMNEKKLEERGATPLQSTLQDIDAIHDIPQLLTVFAKLINDGFNAPLALAIHQDNRDSTHYIPDLGQAGLELPDRDYYLKDGEDGTYKTIRTAYEKHVANMFRLAGQSQPEQSATKVLAIETAIARVQWDNVANRDPVKTYNKYEIRKLSTLSSQVDWTPYLQTIGIIGRSETVNVQQPGYLTELSRMLGSVPLDNWKIYLKWKVISNGAAYLSKAFVDESFAFNGKIVTGTAEIRPRWKRGLGLVDGAMGEALGKLYVQRYFPEENKRRMKELINNLIAAYRQSIDQLDWMSAVTKQQAQFKLSKLAIKVGYPDQWRDYSSLEIDPDDLWGNVIRANEFEAHRQLNKLGKPVDRTEWLMTPQTVNAYYNPEQNEIVFPAAILQPPFFDVHADDAFNYGGIGAVIGHEISHGFDDQGSQYDGEGNLNDWWTKEDHEKFLKKTGTLIAQYE
ncbi:MAG: M13 family metallopeptidase, partial [Steroidobacter sp.]